MPDVEEYTIGCICALSTEAVALRLFLDEEHNCPEIPYAHVSTQDHNVYTTGSIGGHKVVVASLPYGKYGVSQATSVIADMTRSFPNLRCCLLVGIGGGAPSSQHDIRLGDVVVSAPVQRSGGILQYDHGKAIQGQPFRITQHLNEPPRFLLSAVSKLVQDHEMEGHPLQDMVDDILAKKPRLRAKYQRPDSNSDRLYKSSVVHPMGAKGSCEEICGNEACKLVERSPRAAGPGVAEIHYGIIASGSSLMKDAVVRDRLSEGEEVLCFEMEAAGLANQCPCLVIRGICDYADSHKRDEWQGYAAIMAAAYTKEILTVLAPAKVSSAAKVIDRLSEKLSGIEKGVQKLTQDTHDGDKRKRILEWLSATVYADRQNALQRERQAGSGQWFLDTVEFKTWFCQKGKILYCPGMPGAGKTYTASLVIHYIQSCNCSEPLLGLAYIYCEYTQQHTQESLLKSLIEQLVQPQHRLPSELISLFESHEKYRTQPSVEELWTVLHDIASIHERCYIVVDGLDECADDEGVRHFLLETLVELQRSSSSEVNIMATSRDIKAIQDYFEDKGPLQIRIKAQDKDMSQYLDHRIPRVLPLVADKPALYREIKGAIMAAAGGMFLLVVLNLTSLKGKINHQAIENALAEMKSGGTSLVAAYDKTMKMIESQEEGYRILAMKTLSWIAFSMGPLKVKELQHALAIELGKDDLNDKNITELDIIISSCAGLITVQWPQSPQWGRGDGTVHLIHETAHDYFDKNHKRWFGNVRPRLARLSLTYLTFRTFGSGPCVEWWKRQSRATRYPFYEHLGLYLQEYISHCGEDARVKVMLENFFLSDAHIQAHMQFSWAGKSTEPHLTIHLAIWYRFSSLIPLLLHKGPNEQDENGYTPLHLAVLTRFYEGIESLISAPEVDCNFPTPEQRTAISYACELGDEKAVKLLLASDEVDCVTPDVDDLVPLWYATASGSEACVQDLLKRPEVDVNTNLHDQVSVLHWTARGNKIATFAHVLDRPGLDVNIKDRDGRTPLFWSIEYQSYEMTMLLLSREDVELDLVDENGQGLLICAAKWGRRDLIELLLAKIGNQLLLKDKHHLSALDYAAAHANWQAVKVLLKAHKADIQMGHQFKNTALFHAIKSKNKMATEQLLDRINMDGGPWIIGALALSIEDGKLQCFKILNARFSVWMQSHPQWMVACLHCAAAKAPDHILSGMLKALRRNETVKKMVPILNWDSIDILISLFIMPSQVLNMRDSRGQTALHSTAIRGDVATARILLRMGVDKDARDAAGQTAFEHVSASNLGSLKGVRMLLEPSLYGQPLPWDGG